MAKIPSKGITFEHGGAASGVASYTEIPQVKNVEIPGDQADEIDVTTHDSPGGRKEFINGLIDSPDFSLEIVYDPALTIHEALRAAAGGEAQHFKATLAGATANHIHEFDALVKGFSSPVPVDGALMANVTLKRTGADTVSSS